MKSFFRHLLSQKALCPYCFRRFDWRNSPFRCMNSACSDKRTADPVLLANWPGIAPRQKGLVIAPTTRGRSQLCPDCKRSTIFRLCPECHIRLPREFDRSHNAIIAIVGAKGAGKSHYIATAIHELKNRVATEMNFAMEAMDDDTMDRYEREYKAPLYDKREELTATHSAVANLGVRQPMLFTIKLRGKNFLGRSKIMKSITLAFFDAAGEDLSRSDQMSSFNRYVAEASGIIMLLDPIQIGSVRAQFKTPPRLNAIAVDQGNVLTRVTDVVRDVRQLSRESVIPVPVSVALSKFDQLRPIVPEDMLVLKSSQAGRDYDSTAARTVIDEIESLLQRWNCDAILSQVRTNYLDYSFFGVSATGCNVDPQSGQFPFVKPNRVEDPFTWLLHKIGFFKSKAR